VNILLYVCGNWSSVLFTVIRTLLLMLSKAGQIQSWKVGVHFVKNVKDQKKSKAVPNDPVTALLELLLTVLLEYLDRSSKMREGSTYPSPVPPSESITVGMRHSINCFWCILR